MPLHFRVQSLIEEDEFYTLEYLGRYAYELSDEECFIDRNDNSLHFCETVIPSPLKICYGTSECRYWIPARNIPPGGSHWDYVPDDAKQRAIRNYGSLAKADIHYIFQDYLRHESYEYTWEMIGVQTWLSIDGRDLACDSTWSIESDCGEEHLKETACQHADEICAQIQELDWLTTEAKAAAAAALSEFQKNPEVR